ncbi:LuxR C-terminal-related transcriptional regulator [Micromonospora sp. NPDC007208]|uniref:LuxR C-terminal-related transcriptional regulator n=1 Tax=Micromonospora sp. NPDC007208 TaxID=3364236 RepID=UPI0036AAB6C1
MTTIAVVAAGSVVRQGVCRLLAEASSRFMPEGFASLAEMPAELHPDVVVIDWPNRAVDGLAGLLPADSRAVLLCDPADPPDLAQAIAAGARGFLTRDTEVDDLLLAVDAVRHGGIHLAADMLGMLTGYAEHRHLALGEREIELLHWVTRGLTNEQIGGRMSLTKSTVTSYVRQVRSKLNAANKTDLTRRAIELGYVVPL